MTLVAPCPWCKRDMSVVTGGEPVQCEGCKHWFYTPLEEAVETMLKCSQCGRRCEGYTDTAGKRCFLCSVPKP